MAIWTGLRSKADKDNDGQVSWTPNYITIYISQWHSAPSTPSAIMSSCKFEPKKKATGCQVPRFFVAQLNLNLKRLASLSVPKVVLRSHCDGTADKCAGHPQSQSQSQSQPTLIFTLTHKHITMSFGGAGKRKKRKKNSFINFPLYWCGMPRGKQIPCRCSRRKLNCELFEKCNPNSGRIPGLPSSFSRPACSGSVSVSLQKDKLCHKLTASTVLWKSFG